MKRFLFCLLILLVVKDVYAINYYDLYEEMKSKAVSDKDVDYSLPSKGLENGKGIYYMESTKDDKYPVYYFRGDIDNNYLIYHDTCFRILRTTDTGGVKVIYQGNPIGEMCYDGIDGNMISIGTSTFNNTNSLVYNGYMYNDLIDKDFKTLSNDEINVFDSNLKQVTDQWFKSWLEKDNSIMNNIYDEIYCNDREMWTDSYFMSHKRIGSLPVEIDLSCNRLQDSFTVSDTHGNGKLTYPVGHITADELVLSGAEYNGLGVTDAFTVVNKYWSMTPHSVTKILYPNSLNYINRNNINYSTYVRPVITLKDAMFHLGDGTSMNPYIIEEYQEVAPETGIELKTLTCFYVLFLLFFLIKLFYEY